MCSLDLRLVGVFRPEWGSNNIAQGRAERRNVAKRRPGYRKAPNRRPEGAEQLRPSIMDGPCGPLRAICIVLGGSPRAALRSALGWVLYARWAIRSYRPKGLKGRNQRP